jgi:MFS family permease
MFVGTFAWAFVYVSLPFHIQAISTLDPAATLRWTGWILGISSLVTVGMAPMWGRYGERGNPRAMYMMIEALQGLGFFGMALARTLPELFVARLILGFMGAASTFAFIIASRAGSPGAVRRQVAAIQSAMTVGQVIGPLAGAIAAARLGFRTSFVLGGIILLGCAALVRWGVPDVAPQPRPRGREGRASARTVAAVALIILGGNLQIFFLPAVLPQVLPDLGVDPGRTLEVGGVLIFVSGVAAALGALVAPRLGEIVPERMLLSILLAGSSLLVAMMAAAASVWPYGVLRFFQVLAIAPVFPLVVARVAQHAGGQAIGVINSARIGAGFLGPVLATTVLAWTSPALLYMLLGAVGLASAPLVRVRVPRAAL